MQNSYDVIVIGAGAAGMMCAATAGKRGRKVWLVDHASKIGEKIRISGGGRCNFTNLDTRPEAFLSRNPHFCKSALAQYTQHDFIELVKRHNIAFHEKKLGQLFCDHSAQDIIDMLIKECNDAGVQFDMETSIENITATDPGYSIQTSAGSATAQSIVIATGGLSIPKIGATKFGYEIAKQFGLNVIETRAALVPLRFQTDLLEFCSDLSGLSVDATVTCNGASFSEALLFTHRGLSGPSILQISSYWTEGDSITINLAPKVDIEEFLKHEKANNPKQDIPTALIKHLPKRLAQKICETQNASGRISECSNKTLQTLGAAINTWTVKPAGHEGYRKAEVTLRGVDTNALSSKTMECKSQPNLYFIGEVIDVTGWLGGYNFQWAWSSGYVAGINA